MEMENCSRGLSRKENAMTHLLSRTEVPLGLGGLHLFGKKTLISAWWRVWVLGGESEVLKLRLLCHIRQNVRATF